MSMLQVGRIESKVHVETISLVSGLQCDATNARLLAHNGGLGSEHEVGFAVDASVTYIAR